MFLSQRYSRLGSFGQVCKHTTRIKVVSFEDIYNMAQALASKLWEMRIRAAAVFMFLSGICVGAPVSLLLAAVDLESRTVKQWPSLGVQTKLGKHATTYLLDVPELTLVVMAVEYRQDISFLPREADLH